MLILLNAGSIEKNIFCVMNKLEEEDAKSL